MTLSLVRVTGRYVSTDGLSVVDPAKLTAIPPVLLPGEQYKHPVAAKLRGDGEFLLALYADSATSLTYSLSETLGGSARQLDVTVPAGASGELALKDLAGYSQPAGATLTTQGDVSNVSLRAAFGTEVGDPQRGELDATYSAKSSVALNAKDYGAKGDGVTLTDVTVTAGSNIITSPTAQFTSADIGKRIVILPKPGVAGRPTIATTITAVGSATSATIGGAAPTFTSTPVEATYASDDTAALRAWLEDPQLRDRYLPGGIYGLTDSLRIPSKVSVNCDDGATIVVLRTMPIPTDWPAGARTVSTAVYSSHTTLNKQGIGWTGGTIDCSLLCDDGFAPKYMRGYRVSSVVVRLANARMFSFGDSATTSSSYENRVSAIRSWRDMGVVPVGATALNSGGVAGSVGCYVDGNWSDSLFDGKCTMMGSQVGFDTRGSNISHYGSHAWSRATVGWMDYGFDDSGFGTNTYVGTFADTPQWVGYRMRGQGSNLFGAVIYNNSQYGTDNQVVGMRLDSTANHRIVGCYWLADDNTHRIAYQFDPTTLPDYASFRFGNLTRNVVNTWSELPVPRATNVVNFPAASYTMLGSDVGRQVECANTSAITITVPAGRMTTSGQSTEFIQRGAGKVTIAAGAGVTINSPGGLMGTRAQYSTIRLTRLNSADTYLLSGDLGA